MLRAFLIFIYLIATSQGQSCNNFFKYVHNRGDTEGMISFYPSAASEHNLKVLMTIGVPLHSSYVGSLALSKSTQSSIADLSYGSPLLYNIKFPIQNPLPRISEISHNGVPVCYGEGATGYNNAYRTTITLTHRLTLNQVLGGYSPQPSPDYFYENNEHEQHFTQPTRAPSFQQTQRPPVPNRAPSFQQTQTPPVPTRAPSFQQTENRQPSVVPSSSSSSSSNSQCGVRKLTSSTPLIVGGLNAGRAEFPWLVAQYHGTKFTCGGSLVSNRVVITAGHCIHKYSADQTTYYLGKHDITKLNEDGYVTSEVDRFVLHPNYDPQTLDSDIGASILTKRIVFSSTIKPICIWSGGQGYKDIIGMKGVVAGWGLTEHGMTSTTPKYLSLPVVEEGVCLRSHPDFIKITSSQTFCVGDKSGRSPCNGDSGGGFVVKSGEKYYLRGVVSSARQSDDGDCISSDYVVFTDVTVFTSWINDLIQSN